MIFYAFQLLVCFFLFVLLGSLFSSKVPRILISILLGLILSLQFSSIEFGNSLIDYKYYAHFNHKVVLSTYAFFLKEGVLVIISFLASTAFSFFATEFLKRKYPGKKWVKSILIVICISALLLPNGIINNLIDIVKIQGARDKEFNEALMQINYTDYVVQKDLRATAGNNIIVIFMESLEKEFLEDKFAHLTPNLRQLAKEMNFHTMKQVKGGDFTIGAIYTYFTGIPMIFKQHGNYVFERSYALKTSSLPQILNKAGYHQEYLLGNPSFCGMDLMLNLMGVEIRSEADFDPRYRLETWGLHDKDLFEIAKEEIRRLNNREKPFAFYMSTISTHSPNGIADIRMEKIIPPQKSRLELLVASLDYHVGNLVDFLEDEGILENTSIYIMPDHCLMGFGARVLNEFEEPRELYVISNTNTRSNREDILQIDVPNLILDGAGVQHNFTFLTDKIQGDKEKFLIKNTTKILQINESSLQRGIDPDNPIPIINGNEYHDDISITPDEQKIQLISNTWSKGNELSESKIFIGLKKKSAKRGVNLIIKNGNNFNVENYDTWQNEERFKKLLLRLQALVSSKAKFFMLIHDTSGDIPEDLQNQLKEIGLIKFANLKNRQAYMAISDLGFTSELTHSKRIVRRFPIHQNKIRSTDTILAQSRDPGRFIAHAGGAIDGQTYTNSLEALNHSYSKGFKMFELDIIKTSDNHFVASHDWNQWKEKTNFQGEIPVSRETFLKHKILGKYSPLDMKAINEWFQLHPDAIMVTDKINEPDEFIPQFIDPDRLMMELFSIDAVRQAKKRGVRGVLFSEAALNELPEREKTLEKEGIEYLAVSRRTIEKHKDFYQKLKDRNIKVFAFHVGIDDLKDEAYMVTKGMDYCYGFYADNWNFKQ